MNQSAIRPVGMPKTQASMYFINSPLVVCLPKQSSLWAKWRTNVGCGVKWLKMLAWQMAAHGALQFIEQERNQILKKYEFGFLNGPIDVVAGGEHHMIGEQLFCLIADGTFAGEDCRDILQQAIAWWENQLNSIEATVQTPGSRA